MKVYFWGTRGSLPASFDSSRVRPKLQEALRLARDAKLDTDEDIDAFIDGLPFHIRSTYGTNTPCVEIRGGGEPDSYVICDCGSGLRDFSNYVLEQHHPKPQTFHIIMSHFHWDHMVGFPFFVPAYVPGNKVHIYGVHKELEYPFKRQQEEPCFPVPMSIMGADIEFHKLEVGKEYDIGGFKVFSILQNHPGDAYGYSFAKDGQRIVYSSDSEHTVESNKEDYPFVEFFKDADVVIFDAQYELFDAIDTKASWGHSSNVSGVELAIRANAKRLCLFHNEHTADDETLDTFLEETRHYLDIYSEGHPLEIFLSYDGLEIDCSK